MIKLRDYQQRAVDEVRALWASGTKAVCLVAPTGSGKSICGSELAKGRKVLWLTHRRELVKQSKKYLDTGSRVETVQGLLASGERPEADLLIGDECHHLVADEWNQVASHYNNIHVLGLTATPQRTDGRALGDMFDALVVAASYSELVEQGHIVPCKVFRPSKELGRDELANDPVATYMKKTPGKSGFVFVNRVELAHEFAEKFKAEGVSAEVISGKTPTTERDAYFKAFSDGDLKLLINVYVLTEGVDVPAAEVCILARRCQAQGTYLQMVGRVLRPSEGKTEAVLLDLTGVSHTHGLPTDDRVYSLSGTPIRGKSEPVRDCPKCHCVVSKLIFECPECLHEFPRPTPEEMVQPKIWSMELEEVYDGLLTPKSAKEAEWKRLFEFTVSRGWNLGWTIREYQKLFPDEMPKMGMVEKKFEFKRLVAVSKEKDFKIGWAKHQFRAMFGVWPVGEVREGSGDPSYGKKWMGWKKW